jgi:hypothetical protein
MNAHVKIHSGNESMTTHIEQRIIEDAISAACAKVAPLWPLKHFVAVNPFLGFSTTPF